MYGQVVGVNTSTVRINREKYTIFKNDQDYNLPEAVGRIAIPEPLGDIADLRSFIEQLTRHVETINDRTEKINNNLDGLKRFVDRLVKDNLDLRADAINALEGVAFARSYITASEISRLMIQKGEVRRVRLGFVPLPTEGLSIDVANGIPVRGVMVKDLPDRPSTQTGPNKWDFVYEIETTRRRYPIESDGDLRNVLAFLRVGDPVTVRYTRLSDGCKSTLESGRNYGVFFEDIKQWRSEQTESSQMESHITAY